MKDQWKGFALSLAVGLIMGGGVTMAIGSHNLNVAVERLEEQIEDVKNDSDETEHNVNDLAVGMARIEEQLKAANEKLDALAR